MDTSAARGENVQLVWPRDSEPFRNEIAKLGTRTRAKYQIFNPYILASTDVLALLTALILGKYIHWFYFQEYPVPRFFADFGPAWARQTWLFLGLVPLALAWFWGAGHYSRRRPYWDELRETLKILLILGMLDAALVFLAKWPVSRLWLGMTWFIALMLVPLFRTMTKRLLLSVGGWRRPTVIAGIGENALRTAEAMTSEKLMGYDIIAFIAGPSYPANSSKSITIGNHDIPVFYYSSHLWDLLENLRSPHLVVALEQGEVDQQKHLLTAIGEGYRNLHIAPPVTGLPLYGTEIERFFRHEVLLLNVRNNLARLWAKAAKRAFDLFASSILAVLCLPLLGIVATLIKLEDGGPVFYKQERVGRRGGIFRILKFRSMKKNADELLLQWLKENPEIKKEYEFNNFKLRNDPRITRIGHLLRQTSIDELPQLWNVIKGEMSLVGPRPLLEREINSYGPNIHLYKQARPGITGIWQISGRSKTRFSDRSNLDAWYIRNWSLWYDFYILLRTAVVVLKKDGAY
jgi:Undecaprenyl-phosphate galactose phosphotransferase WbaP